MSIEIEAEKTIVLLTPIKDATGKEYTEIHLTEPTLGQLRSAQKAGVGMDYIAKMIEVNAKIPSRAVDSLYQRDMQACADFFGQFGDDTESLKTPGESGE